MGHKNIYQYSHFSRRRSLSDMVAAASNLAVMDGILRSTTICLYFEHYSRVLLDHDFISPKPFPLENSIMNVNTMY
jgi:hypothetical protein